MAKCPTCNSDMDLIRTDDIGGAQYDMFRCVRCNKMIARERK